MAINYIFKYHPLNMHLIEMLTNSTLHMSLISELNDPLDSAYNLSLENFLNLRLEDTPELKTNKEYRDILTSLYKTSLELNQVENLYETGDFRSKLKVCCFTQNDKNQLMWSHYANNNKGVCLKFDLSKDLELKNKIQRVKYVNQLLEIKNKDDFTKCLTIKLKEWEIEKEWRIISENEKTDFNFEALTEITLGLKVPNHTISWLKSFLDNSYFSHTKIFQIKLKNNRLVKFDSYNYEEGDNSLENIEPF